MLKQLLTGGSALALLLLGSVLDLWLRLLKRSWF